jgi:hypothetical protein
MGSEAEQKSTSKWMTEPSVLETVLLGLFTMVITVLMATALGGFWQRYPTFGDNGVYVGIAERIAAADIGGLEPKHLWGYPYFGAALSVVTGVRADVTLLAVCWVSAILALLLTHRLWGGWVASFFAVTSVEWIQQSTMGSAQSLAIALTFGSFLAARRDRWPLAALLASLCTVVRPEGALALLALGLVLLWRRQIHTLAACVAIGILVGAAYAAPMYAAFGDPFANYHTYERQDFSGFIISWPLTAIVSTALTSSSPLTHKAMAAFWMVVVLLGAVAMAVTPHFRQHARRHPYEAAYAALVIAFYLTYNSQHAFHQFARFTLSVVPLAYFALLPWFPKDRRIVWTAGAVTSVFAGASVMNIRRSLALFGRLIGR